MKRVVLLGDRARLLQAACEVLSDTTAPLATAATEMDTIQRAEPEPFLDEAAFKRMVRAEDNRRAKRQSWWIRR